MSGKKQNWVGMLLSIFVASCTSSGGVWDKSDVSDEDKRADYSYCKAYAAREAEREITRRDVYGATSGTMGGGTYQTNMAQYEYRTKRNDMMTRCLKLRGYARERKAK